VSDSGERARVKAGKVAHRAAREVRAALRPFTIPNGITLVRLALTPFFFLAVISSNYRLGLGLLVLAGVTDILDGLVARALSMYSPFGAYLDPIADKFLLVTAYIALTWPNPGAITIPVWLTVMALSRDVLIVLVALLLYMGAGVRHFPPSVWGKVTTFVHIVTVSLVVLANLASVPRLALSVCFYVALVLTIASGLDYVRRAAKTVETSDDEPKR